MKAQTLKGFRDFLPQEASKRQYVLNTLKKVFESYGFEPLETPALEYEEVLKGKYGEEGNKLMYSFEDKGKRKVALRYDQTVPLARVVAQYQGNLPMPFRRYQMQPVWRAENTQKGRYREFLQCDIDTVGTASIFADAEAIAVCVKVLERLGFKKYEILINDRSLFGKLNRDGLVSEGKLPVVLRSLDKLKKIGEAGVVEELKKNGFSQEAATATLQNAKSLEPSHLIATMQMFLRELGVPEDRVVFAPYLARGLDYYTSTIFEIEVEGFEAGSIVGGGRYDKLIGVFAGVQIPAVGASFGFDRLIEAMDANNLFPQDLTTTKVLVTCFPGEPSAKSLEASLKLREAGINTEIYPDYMVKLDKQLKYADKKGVPYVLIIGPEEAKKDIVILKDMRKKEQKEMKLEDVIGICK